MSIFYYVDGEIKLELFPLDRPACFSDDLVFDEISDFITIVSGESKKIPDRYCKAFNFIGLKETEFLLSLPKYIIKERINEIQKTIPQHGTGPRVAWAIEEPGP